MLLQFHVWNYHRQVRDLFSHREKPSPAKSPHLVLLKQERGPPSATIHQMSTFPVRRSSEISLAPDHFSHLLDGSPGRLRSPSKSTTESVETVLSDLPSCGKYWRRACCRHLRPWRESRILSGCNLAGRATHPSFQLEDASGRFFAKHRTRLGHTPQQLVELRRRVP